MGICVCGSFNLIFNTRTTSTAPPPKTRVISVLWPGFKSCLGGHKPRKDWQFFAKCTPVALRNSPNELSIRTVALKWENCDRHEITIPKYSTENLIIAKFSKDYKTMLGEMSLWNLTADGPKQFEWSSWNISPDEKLPEYDLEIRIFALTAPKPHVAKFTLRPRKYSGPLEMFKTRKR